MRMKRYRLLFGSARSRYYQEPKNDRRKSPRGQKVRFRRRAAASMAKNIGLSAWRMTQFGLIAALIFVGGKKGFEFWQGSPTIRVEKIQFQGPVPKNFPEKLGIKPGQNIFLAKTSEQEALAMKRFPELKDVRITRQFDRTLQVKVQRRVPVAYVSEGGKLLAVDEEAVVFPLLVNEKELPLPTLKCQSRKAIPSVLAALELWKKEAPQFYSMVKSVETDKMHAVTIGLKENIFVRWGILEEPALVKRAHNVLTLRQTFAPRVASAELRFITDDRIVMDNKWMRISINKN